MNQRRQQSPAVYRRRRLVAALLGVFVLALLVWGARGLIDVFAAEDESSTAEDPQEQLQDDDAEAADPSQGAASEDEPAEDESAADDSAEDEEQAAEDESGDEEAEEPEGSCAVGDIEVRASTHQDSYGTGVAPLLILEVENIGEEECTLDVGTAEQTFAVSHAGREIFTTDQCSSAEESLELEFEPGQTESAHLPWPRSDSAVDCAEPTELLTGDYELIVAVSGISSDPHTFHVTGVTE